LDSEETRLSPISSYKSADAIQSFAADPYFQLEQPSSALIATSVKDHPVKLTNILDQQHVVVATYPLINSLTEVFVSPHSMEFSLDGTRLVTGTDSLIAVFDVSRDGHQPVTSRPTFSNTRNRVIGGSPGMKGIISSMSINPDGSSVLAAGTFSRNVALYASEGAGTCIAMFSVSDKAGSKNDTEDIAGRGVSQVMWSPCGRYLLVAERDSDAILVYDIRVAGKKLAWLRGRNARSLQRSFIDIAPLGEGWEVWAGGMDGKIKVWTNPHEMEGEIWPEKAWTAHERKFADSVALTSNLSLSALDPVVSTFVHKSGTAVASCCAPNRHGRVPDLAESSQDVSDSSDGSTTDEEAKSESDTSHSAVDEASKNKSEGHVMNSVMKIWAL
jgi:telomerase Cajal body protein 1